MPLVYLGTASGGSPPAFELSSATPSAFDGPKATWLPPERIVTDPEVVPYGPPTTSPAPPAPVVAAPAARRDRPATEDAAKAALDVAVPATTTTTTRTSADGVATETAAAAATTTMAPATTTTTAAPLVTLPAALMPVAPAGRGTGTRTARGKASWFHAPDGTCAHASVPKGTQIQVTRTSSGVSTTCVVTDWGPADASRIIDLSLDTFEQLASPDVGVIEVTIEW